MLGPETGPNFITDVSLLAKFEWKSQLLDKLGYWATYCGTLSVKNSKINVFFKQVSRALTNFSDSQSAMRQLQLNLMNKNKIIYMGVLPN